MSSSGDSTAESSEVPHKKAKSKSPAMTEPEKEILIQLIREQKIIESKKTDFGTIKKKKKA